MLDIFCGMLVIFCGMLDIFCGMLESCCGMLKTCCGRMENRGMLVSLCGKLDIFCGRFEICCGMLDSCCGRLDNCTGKLGKWGALKSVWFGNCGLILENCWEICCGSCASWGGSDGSCWVIWERAGGRLGMEGTLGKVTPMSVRNWLKLSRACGAYGTRMKHLFSASHLEGTVGTAAHSQIYCMLHEMCTIFDALSYRTYGFPVVHNTTKTPQHNA